MEKILYNFKLVDGVSNKVRDDAVIFINDGKITDIKYDIEVKDRNAIDLKGQYLVPGFIDAHVHVESSMVTPLELSKSLIKHGITTIIADPHEIVNVGGGEALKAFIEMTKVALNDVYTVVPSSVPATPYDTNGAGDFLAKDMVDFLDNPRIVGLGEVMCYNDVIENKQHILDKIKMFKDKGLTIDGHTAGLPNELVKDYAKHGISNDHESMDFTEAMVKYDAGLNVYIREGSAARNAKSILTGISENLKNYPEGNPNRLDINRFAFCTDDKHLSDVDIEGTIDYTVRMALNLGINIVDVIKMSSVNASRFYKLNDIGTIEIGKAASLNILDQNTYEVKDVIYRGEFVKNTQSYSLSGQNKVVIPTVLQNTVKYKDFTSRDLDEKIKGVNHAIELVEGQLVTTLAEIKEEEKSKLNMVATVERYGKNGNFSLAYIKGYSIKGGALALSVSHDSHNVICIGDNTSDMAIAINRLKALGGGAAIVCDGEIEGELTLDIGGLMSSDDGETVKEKIANITKVAYDHGVNRGIDPIITLSFVALPVIPFVRLLDTGLFDVINRKFIK